MRRKPPAAITIARRFRGPDASGNGGYTCGVLAAFVDGDAEVTLRMPPPLDRELAVRDHAGSVVLLNGDDVLAEAVPVSLELDVPAAVEPGEAREAATRYSGFEEHEFPTCFVCGPERDPGDGLRIFPGSVGVDGLVAAPWTPEESLAPLGEPVPEEFVWSALDCPGAFAVGFSGRGAVVLGRFAAHVAAVPAVGDQCVVVGWPLGEEGRKRFAGTALFAEDGRALAYARATWIEPRD